jgi:uncharacterized protein (TIGR02001 family)
MQRTRRSYASLIFLRSGQLLIAALWLVTSSAGAQISANLSAVSDYRYRGMSLSQGNPEVQLSVGYDHPDGWYGGGMISGVDLDTIHSAQLIAYGGYTSRLMTDLSWEGGISNNTFNRLPYFDYSEAYVGLTSESYNVRVYYSPSYFNQRSRTLYGEFNASYALHDSVQLLFHGGVLNQIDASLDGGPASRFDYRAGLNARYNEWNCQLAWVGLQQRPTDYPQYQDTHLHSWVLSIARSF